MAEPRELTPEEREKGFTSIRYVRPAPPTVRGYEIVDIETGKKIGHIPQPEYERRQRGQRKFRGELFVTVPTRPEVEAAIRRREEKQYEVEMAAKRAGIEREEGETITELKRRIAETEEVPEPEVPARELERQERILATLEKQRQFAMLTESQQRVVRTLVKQGKEVRFERGVIITEEAGRKVIITPEAIAKVPVTAEVDIKELERLSREIKARERVEVRPILEPEIRREITPEEKRIADFERRARALKEREEKFYTSKGFKRIEALAEKLPLIGKTELGREVLTTLMSYPIALGGYITSTFEKLMLTGEATTIPELRAGVRRELLERAPKEALEVYKRPATFVTAALFALPTAAGLVAVGRPIARVTTGVIRPGIKTTIIKFRGEGVARALGVKVGKRAVFVGVGKVAPPPPRGIMPVPPRAIVPRGIAPPTPTFVIPPTVVSARELIRVRAKETIQRAREQTIQDVLEGIIPIKDVSPSIRKEVTKRIRERAKPLDIKPVGIFGPIEEIPLYEPPTVARVRAKEAAQRAREQTIEDVISGVIDIKDVSPSIRKEVTKRIRKEALARRGIAPLEIKPVGIFAPIEEIPLYEPPTLAKLRKKEAERRALTQTIYDIRKGIIPLEEVSPRVRKAYKRHIKALRKKAAQETRWWYEMRGLKRPTELVFDIGILPIPYWKIVKPKVKPIKPPEPRKVIRLPKPPEEVVTREGLVLILKPPKVKVVSKQELKAISKVERKTLTAAQRQALAQVQAQRQRTTLNQMLGYESIQQGRLAFALGIIPRKEVRVRPISVVDIAQAKKIAQAQTQAQAEAQARGEVSISGLEDIQISALTETQIQAKAEAQASAVEQAMEQVQREQLVEKVPSPLKLKFLFRTPEKEKVKLIKSIGFGEEGYDVYVKRKKLKKGKGSYRSRGFKKANIEPLSREAALGLGASRVDTYTNRSFFIEETKQKIKRRRQDLINKWRALSHKFRASKKKPNVLVEESAYAIDHPVEVAGIPYEAARLRRAGLLQQKITFIKTQQKKEQLKGMIAKKQQQSSFISSPKKSKKKGGSSIKFL